MYISGNMDGLLQAVSQCVKEKLRCFVAIDGRCASGKTTLARYLQGVWECPVFHMDDFFLQPSQRTKDRLAIPGENIDHERFEVEILQPWLKGCEIHYRPYDCHSGSLLDSISVSSCSLAVVEGSYSCHKSLRDYYQMRIFMDIDAQLQEERIRRRNGDRVWERFREVWIPLEEAYFSACSVEQCCQWYFKAGE